VLVILAGLLVVASFVPELPQWMTRDRWTRRRFSRGHIVARLTLVLIAARRTTSGEFRKPLLLA
jgi:hypothetical protein